MEALLIALVLPYLRRVIGGYAWDHASHHQRRAKTSTAGGADHLPHKCVPQRGSARRQDEAGREQTRAIGQCKRTVQPLEPRPARRIRRRE